ncbi:MAG: hypothetical protein D6689_11500 [Deltaproteobacteria bacterium]|nr:MAG: hypothetical protein D6689_11500 [Deltaproteobacteria bacterium]
MTATKAAAAVGAAVAVALGAAGPAAAGSPHSGVDADLYKPSVDALGLWTLDAAQSLPRYDFSFKFGIGFVQSPLNVAVPGIGDTPDDTATDPVLKFTVPLHITLALAITNRLTIAFDGGMLRTNPDQGYGERGLYRTSGADPSTGLISLRPVSNIDPSGGFVDEGKVVPTDARVGFKYKLFDNRRMQIALLGTLSLPFGDEEMFVGDDGFVIEPKLAYERRLGTASRLLFNAGLRIRNRNVLEAYNAAALQTPDDAVAVLEVGSEAMAGLGVQLALASRLTVGGELTAFYPIRSLTLEGCRTVDGRKCGALKDEDFFDPDMRGGDPAAMALAGAQFRMTADTSLHVAGGTDRLIGDGRGADFRVMTAIVWQPTPEGARVIGRGDADGDGVPDQIDICPDEPEDTDGYQDDDGCPDLDNDGDGVIDAEDQCRDEPEDRDGYQDDDGCPERDNDGDGVPDVTDRCPGDPEDMDKFEDDDGCPDEDNDGDGIPDAKDQCPNEPETVNGTDDTDGCPDDIVAGGVQMDPGRINLGGSRIEFSGATSAKLTKADRAILDDIAALLNQPEYRDVRIRIEVHVPLGTKSRNRRRVRQQQARDLRLAQQRANAVRDYLVSKGVDAGRLQAAGLGSRLPIVQPPTDPRNARIDFIRTEQR